MKILVGSYQEGLYEVTIDTNKDKFVNKSIINNKQKVSYLINEPFSYIYLDNKKQYIYVDNDNVLLYEGACHIAYNNNNNSLYTAFYGDGLLKVLQKNNNWEVVETIKYPSGSHIHYTEYLTKQNLVGVVNLGLDEIYFYTHNNMLKLVQTLKFPIGYGPRHFISHPKLPLIYVISELIPTIHVLKYESNQWIEIANHQLEKGAGSAIRISENGQHLFAAVRETNNVFHFTIDEKGNLSLENSYSTLGDHPRDINLVNSDNYLVIANMHSNNLTLYKLENGKLILKDSNFDLLQGATITYYK